MPRRRSPSRPPVRRGRRQPAGHLQDRRRAPSTPPAGVPCRDHGDHLLGHRQGRQHRHQRLFRRRRQRHDRAGRHRTGELWSATTPRPSPTPTPPPPTWSTAPWPPPARRPPHEVRARHHHRDLLGHRHRRQQGHQHLHRRGAGRHQADRHRPGRPTVEATGPDGATVTYDAATAVDDVDGALTVTAQGIRHGVPARHHHGHLLGHRQGRQHRRQLFTVTVQDTTAPAVTVPANMTKEATSADGATATFSATASDAVDGSVTTTCAPVPDRLRARLHKVICSATDDAGNTGSDSFTVTVQDTTAPRVTVPGEQDRRGHRPQRRQGRLRRRQRHRPRRRPDEPELLAGLRHRVRPRHHHGHLHGHRRRRQQRHRQFAVTVVDTTAPEVPPRRPGRRQHVGERRRQRRLHRRHRPRPGRWGPSR